VSPGTGRKKSFFVLGVAKTLPGCFDPCFWAKALTERFVLNPCSWEVGTSFLAFSFLAVGFLAFGGRYVYWEC
jgi:hypothetical protein